MMIVRAKTTATTMMMAKRMTMSMSTTGEEEDETWWDIFMLCFKFLNMRKENGYIYISKCFLVSFLLVNGRRNWGQLNKWAVLHFPSNIVQITCHCYNEKEHTILPNVTWRASQTVFVTTKPFCSLPNANADIKHQWMYKVTFSFCCYL